MTSQIDLTRTRILTAMAKVLQREGVARLTTDRIATQAGCAKGLINYHFGSKERLSTDFLHYLGDRRRRRWIRALRHNPADAVSATWRTVRADASQRLVTYVATVAGTGRTIDQAIAEMTEAMVQLLGGFAVRILAELQLSPTIPEQQIGWMLSAMVDGAALQLTSPTEAQIVEDGYAAAWLGVLALGEPA